jgi:hypothetical protein
VQTHQNFHVSYTLWPSLYDTHSPQQVTESWTDLVARFHRYTPLLRKDLGQGFGPYVLRTGPNGPSRRDDWVQSMTMAVFDVDVPYGASGASGMSGASGASGASPGGPLPFEDLDECFGRLGRAGLAQIWYTTYSHSLEKPSLRLVLPLAEPLPPDLWTGLRAYLIERYRIPCDARKCSGLSHFYYLPSHPVGGGEAFSDAYSGEPVSWRGLDLAPSASPGAGTRHLKPPLVVVELSEDPDGDEQVDLSELRRRLEARAKSLSLRKSPEDKAKAAVLRRVLKGEPLAEHGSRNDTTARAAGMLAWTLPETPVGVLVAILRPSVEAMIGEGSSLTIGDVRNMVASALRKRLQQQGERRALQEALNAWSRKQTEAGG